MPTLQNISMPQISTYFKTTPAPTPRCVCFQWRNSGLTYLWTLVFQNSNFYLTRILPFSLPNLLQGILKFRTSSIPLSSLFHVGALEAISLSSLRCLFRIRLLPKWMYHLQHHPALLPTPQRNQPLMYIINQYLRLLSLFPPLSQNLM
jgi:hypothetical protein